MQNKRTKTTMNKQTNSSPKTPSPDGFMMNSTKYVERNSINSSGTQKIEREEMFPNAF